MRRDRKFTPLNLFLSVVHLASGTNYEGYDHALRKTWEATGEGLQAMPSKSSLSEARSKLSYTFFEGIYQQELLASRSQRKCFRGYHVYAIDGDQFNLPASKDILDEGFTGYPSSKNRETYYPKMYTVQLLDVLDGTIRAFDYDRKQCERASARLLVSKLEKNSITIYDRFHSGYETFLAHQSLGNHFIIRLKTGQSCSTSGKGVHLEVQKFCRSKARSRTVLWKPARGLIRKSPKVYLRLVKVKNKKTKAEYVFATSLPEKEFGAKAIGDLYQRRWDIETAFKEFTHILKIEQWHSKTLNGVLQEIYALLWLLNSVRRQLIQLEAFPDEDLLEKSYRKGNIKLTVLFVLDYLHLLIKNKWEDFFNILSCWIRRTVQRRKRHSRSYPREVKHRGREYKQNNLVSRRMA